MAGIPLTRRAMLVAAGLSVAAGGCARARPTSVPLRGLLLVSGKGSADERLLLQQFNAAQTSVQAELLPLPVQGLNGPPPSLTTAMGEASATLLGSGLDLTSWIQAGNTDLSGFVPGVWGSLRDHSGAIWSVPLRVGITVLQVDASALGAAGVLMPADGMWPVEKFVESVPGLAAKATERSDAFGPGLGWSIPQGVAIGMSLHAPPVWFGFARGYGGQVVAGDSVTLTSGPVLTGLDLYGNVLQRTAVTGMRGVPPSGPWLGFGVLPVSAAEAGIVSGKEWKAARSPLRFLRFPVFPVDPVVPALVTDQAGIPAKAPHPDRGAAFLMWLLSKAGQVALNAAGFTATRTDIRIPSPWWAPGALGGFARLDQLTFVPGALSALVDFSQVMFPVLAQPPAVRQAKLVALQATLNHYLAGTATTSETLRILLTKVAPLAPNGPD